MLILWRLFLTAALVALWICLTALIASAQPLPPKLKAIVVPPRQAVLSVVVSNGCGQSEPFYYTNPGPIRTASWVYEGLDCAGNPSTPQAYQAASATLWWGWLGRPITNSTYVGTNTAWVLRLKATNVVHHFLCASGNLAIANSPTGTWTVLNGRTLMLTNPTNPRLFARGARATNWVERF